MSTKKALLVVNAGRLAYGPAFDLQRELVAARKLGTIPDVLLFVEHPHVITLGRNGETKNLLASNSVLKQMNVEFAETDRGGDITYHGPGQIVGYPILDLTQHKRDVRWYVEQLEEVMIRTAADYGLHARRILCHHGIWIDPPAVRQGTASAMPSNVNASGIPSSEGNWEFSGGRSLSSDINDVQVAAALAAEAKHDQNQLVPSLNATNPAPEARKVIAQRVSAGETALNPSAGGAAQLTSTHIADQTTPSTEAVAKPQQGITSHANKAHNQLAPSLHATIQAPEARHTLAQPVRAGETQEKSSAVGAAQTNSQTCTPPDDGPEEKLAALGVHLSRWVTSHGFAFNVATDLRFFDLIIPCGLEGKRATSLERALGHSVSIDEARAHLTRHFAEIFDAAPETKSLADLRAILNSRIPSTV